MSVTSMFPVPAPTPYQSPRYGGSIFAPVGQQGPYMSPTQQYPQPIGPGMGIYGSQDVYTPNTGQTLGVQNPTPAPIPQSQQQTQQNTGGDWGSIYQSQYPGWGETEAKADWIARGSPTSFGNTSGSSTPSIDYTPYFNSLDEQLGIAGGSAESGKATVQSQYEQALRDAALSNTQQQDIFGNQRTETEQNRIKTLKDISTNLRNSFMAGNIYLGARGAGDSSAANQYSYALTKLGNQQRGDVQSQVANILKDIGQRETNLAAVFANEKQKLATARDAGINQVVQWFDGVKQQLAGLKGEALRTQSEQAYATAVNELNRIKTESSNLTSQLQTWALNNSKTLAEAKAKLSGVSATGYNQPTQQPLVSTPVTDAGENFRQTSLFGGGGGYVGSNLTDQQKKAQQDIYNIGSGNWWR